MKTTFQSGTGPLAGAFSEVMRSLRVLVAIALLLGLAPAPAAACTCIVSTPLESAARAEVIFVGRLTATEGAPFGIVRSSLDPITYRFAVERALKGTVRGTAAVKTANSSASCGLDGLEVGKRFTVFGYVEDGELTTNLCSGTHEGDPDPAIAGMSGVVLPDEAQPPPAWAIALVGLAAALAVLLGLRLRRRGVSAA